MSKSRAATMSMKAGSPSRPPGSTTGSSSTALRAAPAATGPWPPRRSSRASSASSWSREPSATSLATASAFKPNTAPPEQLDFDIWLGPAPKQPYHANLVHYNWHWFWDFGNGDIGNQGVHQMDIARWLIPPPLVATQQRDLPQDRPEPGRPVRLSRPGRDGQHPDLASWTTATPSSSSRSAACRRVRSTGQKVGNIAHLEAGILAERQVLSQGKDKPVPLGEVVKVEVERGPGNGHFGNFIAAVRSRKVEDLNADILEGHYSAALCHLANISYRLGHEVPFNKPTEAFGDDKEAYETLGPHGRTPQGQQGRARRPELPAGPQARLRRRDRVVPGRSESQPVDHAGLSGAVCRAGEDCVEM